MLLDTASNLSELYLTLGDVTQALAYAEQSVGLADQSGDEFERMGNRTTLGDALHQAGRLAESQTAFHEAEEMQKKNQPEFPLLYSLQGFRYCDLLLSQGDYAEVERRASQTIGMGKARFRYLLDIALDNLSLGRAQLLHFQHDPKLPITQFTNYLKPRSGWLAAGRATRTFATRLARARGVLSRYGRFEQVPKGFG